MMILFPCRARHRDGLLPLENPDCTKLLPNLECSVHRLEIEHSSDGDVFDTWDVISTCLQVFCFVA